MRPVYAGAPAKLDPQARALCRALHGLPEERRASCCGGAPGVTLAEECTRVLSLALAFGNVQLDGARVSACLAAQDTALQGCGWLGPTSPSLPEACQGLTSGKLERGARCRSALECRDGLRCRGLGPTEQGVCDAPGAPATACDVGADPLAVYLRQDGRGHPECSGACVRRTCVAAAALGEGCTFAAQCGPEAHCAGGGCAAGRHAREGEACVVGACEPGAVCRDGTCLRRKPEGAICRSDEECLAACLRPDGGVLVRELAHGDLRLGLGREGVCGMRCER